MQKENDINSLSNYFLIALPILENTYFGHTVSLICRHDEHGAMGLVFNKLSNVSFSDILSELNITPSNPEYNNLPIYDGGPVHRQRGFILHSPLGNWQTSIKVNDDIAITSSKDIIEAIANGEGPDNYLITLGCAGWSQGQLEQELLNNSWITTPLDSNILFAPSYADKWQRSVEKIGVDINKIAPTVGFA